MGQKIRMFWISGVLRILNWTMPTYSSFHEGIQKSQQIKMRVGNKISNFEEKKIQNRANVGVDLKLLGCWPIRRDVITMAVQKFECVKFAISVRVNNFETAKIRAIL